jgi:hypothetical protein
MHKVIDKDTASNGLMAEKPAYVRRKIGHVHLSHIVWMRVTPLTLP